MSTESTNSANANAANTNLPGDNLNADKPPTPEESMLASRKIPKSEVAKVSGGRALLGALFTGLSNIATLPVNIASFILGGAAGKACGKTQEGREGATLALGLTIGLPFTLAGLGLSLIATALKNSEKPNFQDTFKDAFMNSNRLNFSSRLHEAAEKDLNQGMAELVADFNKENLSTAEGDAGIPKPPSSALTEFNESPSNSVVDQVAETSSEEPPPIPSDEGLSDQEEVNKILEKLEKLSQIKPEEPPPIPSDEDLLEEEEINRLLEMQEKDFQVQSEEPSSIGSDEAAVPKGSLSTEPAEEVAETSSEEPPLTAISERFSDELWNYDFVDEREMPKRREELKEAIKSGSLLDFQYAPAPLRDDYELALLAVSKNSFMLEHVGDSMKKNDDILKTAIAGFGRAIQYVPAEKQTEELIRLALRSYGSAFQYVNDSVKTAELVNSLINEKEVVDAKGNVTKEKFPKVLDHTPEKIRMQVMLQKNLSEIKKNSSTEQTE